MNDSHMDLESLGDGSDIELRDRAADEYKNIFVTTDVQVTEEETGGRQLARELKNPLSSRNLKL